MKKKKKILILMLLILLFVIGIVVTIKNKNETNNYIQKVNMNNNEFENTKINGIELTNGKIEKNGDIYLISMVASNNTEKDIDLSDYRISFRNKNDEEIEWFRGTIVGVLESNKSLDFYVESYADLSKLDHLYYEYFDFEN